MYILVNAESNCNRRNLAWQCLIATIYEETAEVPPQQKRLKTGEWINKNANHFFLKNAQKKRNQNLHLSNHIDEWWAWQIHTGPKA